MYEDNDKFAKLKAIQSGQATATGSNFKNWKFEEDGDLMGTIQGFNSFTLQGCGEQHTATVCLAESGELVSVFLNGWLQEGFRRQQAAVGDLILLRSFGKPPGERFIRYQLEIQKDQPETF